MFVLLLILLGPLPEATWNGQTVNYICNSIDLFSSEVISVPCTTNITAAGCAELFFTHVFPLWGIVRVSFLTVMYDGISRFGSYLNGMGTTLFRSTSYHPQTNGRIERIHRTMNQMFRHYVDEDQKNWPQQLPFIVFSINSMKSVTTGYSPYELTRTVMPKAVPSWATCAVDSQASEILENAKLRIRQARDTIDRSRISQGHQANKKRTTRLVI